MSYSDPSVLDCVRELKGAGCTRLIVLPLYPQSAYSTTGSVSDSVERALKKARWDVPCDFVDNYPRRPHLHPRHRCVHRACRFQGGL